MYKKISASNNPRDIIFRSEHMLLGLESPLIMTNEDEDVEFERVKFVVLSRLISSTSWWRSGTARACCLRTLTCSTWCWSAGTSTSSGHRGIPSYWRETRPRLMSGSRTSTRSDSRLQQNHINLLNIDCVHCRSYCLHGVAPVYLHCHKDDPRSFALVGSSRVTLCGSLWEHLLSYSSFCRQLKTFLFSRA